MPRVGPRQTNLLQFYGYKKSFAERMIGYGSADRSRVFFAVVRLVGFLYSSARNGCSEGAANMKKFAFAASVAAIGTLTLLRFPGSCSRLEKRRQIIAIRGSFCRAFIGTTIAPRSRNTVAALYRPIARSSR